MTKNRKLLSGLTFLVGALILVLSACKKHQVVPPPTSPTPPATNVLESGTNINASFGGTILDESNIPVSNALVTVGNKTAYTDADGIFYITNTSVDSDRAYIKVTKSGYFLGSRAVNPTAGTTSYIEIKLITKTSNGTFSNSSGGVVNVAGGPILTFTAGDVSHEDGTPYTGNVTVYASYLDPTANDIGTRMPGNLQAIDSENSAVVLETYGMVAVELLGSNGEKLNVTAGQSVTLKMPVQPNQVGSAPSTIPLWSFNEEEGYWLEEGSATLQGNTYTGEVSHFSFWNCDDPYSFVNFKVTLKCNLAPVVGVQVQMHDINNTYIGSSVTDANGNINEAIPIGVHLIMTVLDPFGGIAYTQDIGTNSTNVNLGIIQVCPNYTSSIQGLIVDCNNVPVVNGLIKANIGGTIIPIFTNNIGEINAVIYATTLATINVIAYDITTGLESGTMSFNSGSIINLGTMTTCNQIDEYILYNLDGTNFEIYDNGGAEVNASVYGGKTKLIGINTTTPPNSEFQFIIPTTTAGTFTNAIYELSFISDDFSYTPVPYNAVTFNLITYGTSIGSYIQGNFNGIYLDSLGATRNLNGEFRIRREF